MVNSNYVQMKTLCQELIPRGNSLLEISHLEEVAMSVSFFQKVLLILKDYCDNEHGGNMRAASRALGLDPDTGVLFRWLQCLKDNPKNKRTPNLESVGPCMDRIGAVLLAPGEVFSGNPSKAPEDTTPCAQQTEALEAEVASLRKQLDLMRTERDMARGQAQALKEQMERLVPTFEKSSQQSPYHGKTGSNKTIVA